MPATPSFATVAAFKAQFRREWPYGAGTDRVQDLDITQALAEAASYFNQGLWDTTEAPTWYNILSAHVLVLNIQAAGGLNPLPDLGQGLTSSGEGPVAAKSAGDVSLTLDRQDDTLKDPGLAWFQKTEYGMKYAAQLAQRRCGAGAMVVAGPQDLGAVVPQVPFI